MHQIRLKVLRFSNILSYGANVNEVIFGDGLTWIKGPNGSGKSTIIEALNFALFSSSFRKMTKGELRNTANKGKLKVELQFEREDAKGIQQFSITREMGKGSPKTIIEKDGIEQTKEAGYSQKVFEEEVLGFNQNIFENVISLNTIETTPFIDMDPGRKRKLIESMLTLQIDKFKDANKKALKEAQTKLESAKSDVVKYEKDLNELNQMLNQIKAEQSDDIDELYKEIDEIKEKINKNNVDIDELQNKYDNLIELGTKKGKELDNHPNYSKMMQDITLARGLLESLENIEIKRKESYKKSKDADDDFVSFKHDLKPIDKNILSSKRDKLEQSKKAVAGLKSLCVVVDEQRKDIEKKGKELKSGVECPTCGKPSTEDDIEALRAEYRVQWKKSKETLSAHKSDINSHEKIINQLNSEIEELEEKKSLYEKAELDLSNAKQKSERLKEEYLGINDDYINVANRISDVGYKDKSDDDLANILSEYEEKQKERDELSKEISDLRSDARVLKSDINNFNKLSDNLNNAIKEINKKIESKKLKSDDDSVTLMEKKINGTENDFSRAKTRVTKYSDEISITKYIESMYDDDGIKKIVLGIFVPNLNKAIAHNLNLFNLPFMIEFDDAMDYRFESRFGLAPSYNALSQGQKRKLNFAIAVAFRDFVTSIADFKINILFLDEVLDISTDEEALEHMIQLLKAKVPEIGGTYLMTHRGEQFSEYFEYCIQVQNNGRYSSLEMKELPKSSNY